MSTSAITILAISTSALTIWDRPRLLTGLQHLPVGHAVVAACLCSYGLYDYGLYSYGLYSYGLYRYGLYSYGPYSYGDARGHAGTLSVRGLSVDETLGLTSWFAVYRPCSRDSIAKMLGRVGVGKGLNVKGKSSKRHVIMTNSYAVIMASCL